MSGAAAGTDGVVVEVGGLSRSDLVAALREHGVQLNAHAETLLEHAAFDELVPATLRIVDRSVEDLGLSAGGSLEQVFSAARTQGLELCPATTGPYLRLALMEQSNAPDSVLSAGRAPAGALHVAAEPLSEDDEYPKGFYLRVVDGVVWLRGYRCDDTYVYPSDQRFAFVLQERS